MIVVGLTGGIASGKSTVSRFLSDAGALIIDADQIARKVVEKGAPAYFDIVDHFGEEILLTNGTIDRKRLGDLIFNDAGKKALLNTIVHPRVNERTEQMLSHFARKSPGAVIVLDIPLLFEAGREKGLAETIVVYVPEAVQLERLMKRDGIDEKAAMARIRSQMPIEEKRKKATIVIDNGKDVEATRHQALAIYQGLKERALQTVA